jgi:peroxiredoxin Q/BCP
VLTAWGAYGEKTMYGKTVQGVIRSTFVVDENGKIVEAHSINESLHLGVLERAATAEALLLANLASHGQVAP